MFEFDPTARLLFILLTKRLIYVNYREFVLGEMTDRIAWVSSSFALKRFGLKILHNRESLAQRSGRVTGKFAFYNETISELNVHKFFL